MGGFAAEHTRYQLPSLFASHTLYAVSPESVSAQPSFAGQVVEVTVMVSIAVDAPFLFCTVMV